MLIDNNYGEKATREGISGKVAFNLEVKNEKWVSWEESMEGNGASVKALNDKANQTPHSTDSTTAECFKLFFQKTEIHKTKNKSKKLNRHTNPTYTDFLR